MEVKRLVFNQIQENTYVIWDETKECAIIDAGNSYEQENQYLFDLIEQQGLTPVVAINTHGHFDHAMGVECVRAKYNTLPCRVRINICLITSRRVMMYMVLNLARCLRALI